mgnify:CR=1 FL=1
MVKSVRKNTYIFFIRIVYVFFRILFFPLYIINKLDFNKNTKNNPFYKSLYVQLSERYPFVYEKSMFILNFPKPTVDVKLFFTVFDK